MSMRTSAILTVFTLSTITGCGGAEMNPPARSAAPVAAYGEVPPSPVREMQRVTLGALTFDVMTAGPKDGTPVILLHGFPETAREWTSQMDALSASGYRVIAPNQRGYSPGARPREVAAYALLELVRDVLGIADALGVTRFHLVGHDWGSSVAWVTAAIAPNRILTLNTVSVGHPDAFARTSVDPNSCQPKASSYFGLFISPEAERTILANEAAYLRNLYSGLPRQVVDEYMAFFNGPALTGGLNWYRANVGPGAPRGSLGPISVPTMLVWSDGDVYLCRDGAAMTREYVTGPYRFEVIEGVSHWVPELGAERLNSLLLEHLTAHPQKL